MLLKNNDTILRVLQSHDDKVLVIDCIKKTMPKWVEKTALSDYVECCDTEMYECTDYPAGRTLIADEAIIKYLISKKEVVSRSFVRQPL